MKQNYLSLINDFEHYNLGMCPLLRDLQHKGEILLVIKIRSINRFFI